LSVEFSTLNFFEKIAKKCLTYHQIGGKIIHVKRKRKLMADRPERKIK